MTIRDAVRKIKLLFKLTECECVKVIYVDSSGNKQTAYFHRDQNVARKIRRMSKILGEKLEILEIKENFTF